MASVPRTRDDPSPAIENDRGVGDGKQGREYDDVVYDPVSRRESSRAARRRASVDRVTRGRGRSAAVEISRLDCLKAALRNFFWVG